MDAGTEGMVVEECCLVIFHDLISLLSYATLGHLSRGGGTTHGSGLGPSHQLLINQENKSLPIGHLMEALSQLKFPFLKNSSLC